MSGETVLVIDDSPTILKVVQLILTKAGFQVDTAADGEQGMRAAQSTRPDLILLDFVMPRMNGYQVCRALAADDELKDIPVVLMSAKGDQVGERFVKVMGIVDYITKPFSPEAITAVVQHSIAKYGDRPSEDYTKPLISAAALPDMVGRSGSRADTDAGAATGRAEELRTRIGDAVARKVAALLSLSDATDVGAGRPIPITDENTIAEAARAALDDDLIAELARAAVPIAGDTAQPSLQGELRVVPIAEVLQLLDAQKQSGTLEVAREGGVVQIYFGNGRVELAAASGVDDEFMLGRFIIESELMTRQDLDDFVATRGARKLIGAELVSLGYLTDAGLRTVLARQTSELIYEVLRWNFGTFSFVRSGELPAEAVDASLALDVEGILMEGFRRVDEWHLIEREVDDFDTVFLRNEDAVAQMGRGRLTREEITVLELVNGKNSVKEIVRSSRMGSFEVSKMLFRLLSIKLIRRRVMPVAV